MTEPPIRRIEQLPLTIGAHGEIRSYRANAIRVRALDYLEITRTVRVRWSERYLIYSRDRRRVCLKRPMKLVDVFSVTLNMDLDCSGYVAHPSMEGMQSCQTIDKGTKADPLHNAGNAKKPRGNYRRRSHRNVRACPTEFLRKSNQLSRPSPVSAETRNTSRLGLIDNALATARSMSKGT